MIRRFVWLGHPPGAPVPRLPSRRRSGSFICSSTSWTGGSQRKRERVREVLRHVGTPEPRRYRRRSSPNSGAEVSKGMPEEGICLRRFSTARTWTEANAL
jgi:hypothetical protein